MVQGELLDSRLEECQEKLRRKENDRRSAQHSADIAELVVRRIDDAVVSAEQIADQGMSAEYIKAVAEVLNTVRPNSIAAVRLLCQLEEFRQREIPKDWIEVLKRSKNKFDLLTQWHNTGLYLTKVPNNAFECHEEWLTSVEGQIAQRDYPERLYLLPNEASLLYMMVKKNTPTKGELSLKDTLNAIDSGNPRIGITFVQEDLDPDLTRQDIVDFLVEQLNEDGAIEPQTARCVCSYVLKLFDAVDQHGADPSDHDPKG